MFDAGVISDAEFQEMKAKILAGSAQRFLSSHGPIYNAFNQQSHLISRPGLRVLRGHAEAVWAASTRAA